MGLGSPKDEARKVYDAFREAGGNFIDTANFYTNGTSESFLRRVYQGPRQKRGAGHEILHAAPGTDQTRPAINARYDAGRGSEPQAAAHRLHRPVLGSHLGPNYARRRSQRRAG